MRWRASILLLLVLAGCTRRERKEESEAAPDPTRSEEQRVDREQGQAIIALIQGSQRRGLRDQDLAAFMSIWGDDARVVEGRGAEPGPRDELLPLERIEHFWRKRGNAADDDYDMEVEYSDERADVRGQRAEVRWKLIQRYTHKRDKAVIRESYGERWILVASPAGWRVIENRMWPLAYEDATLKVTFDEAAWRRFDTAVDDARKSGDTLRLLDALHSARRNGEGHDEAVRATTLPGAGAAHWRWRATFARRLYFFDDTALALRREAELDPSIEVPAWARDADPNAGPKAQPSGAAPDGVR
jgi:hypothetical protein